MLPRARPVVHASYIFISNKKVGAIMLVYRKPSVSHEASHILEIVLKEDVI